MDFPQVFACHISYVILTDVTLECLLSKSTSYMHILYAYPSNRQFTLGTLLIQTSKYCHQAIRTAIWVLTH